MTTIIKSYIKDVDDHVDALIKKHNLKSIGRGIFGETFGSKTNSRVAFKVVKFGKCDRLNQDAYYNYLTKIVLKQQTNPLVPRVKTVEKMYVNKRVAGYIVKMERLTRLYNVPERQLNKAYNMVGIESLNDLMLRDENKTICIVARDKTGGMKRLVRPLMALFRSHGEDIHGGNVSCSWSAAS